MEGLRRWVEGQEGLQEWLDDERIRMMEEVHDTLQKKTTELLTWERQHFVAMGKAEAYLERSEAIWLSQRLGRCFQLWAIKTNTWAAAASLEWTGQLENLIEGMKKGADEDKGQREEIVKLKRENAALKRKVSLPKGARYHCPDCDAEMQDVEAS